MNHATKAKRATPRVEVLRNEPQEPSSSEQAPTEPAPPVTLDVLLVAACDMATSERDWDTADVLIRLIERRLPSRQEAMTEDQKNLSILAIEEARAIVVRGRKEDDGAHDHVRAPAQ